MIKKIKTQAEIEKDKRRNKYIIGIVLGGILLLSSLGFSFMEGGNSGGNGKVEEGGLEFERFNGLWKTKINGIDFSFQNLPSEVADVPTMITFGLNDYAGATVYFVNAGTIAGEILGNLNSYILRAQEACLKGDTCGKDLPIKDCNDKLIIYKEGNLTGVSQNQNCVYLEGDANRAADAFLYKILGVN